MISEFMLNILFSILNGLLSVLPDISWTVDVDKFAPFFQIIAVAGYLLPMGTIVTIVGLVMAITVFRIIISIVKTIWDLLPIV